MGPVSDPASWQPGPRPGIHALIVHVAVVDALARAIADKQRETTAMPIYEMRTYTVHVGKMPEVVEAYRTLGWPVIERHPKKLVGYFLSDIGALNQLIHLWKFDDDADRRAFWKDLFADEDFMVFARTLRPLLQHQENRLLAAAPWGPQP